MPRRKRRWLIAAFVVSLLFICYLVLPGLVLDHVTGTSLIRQPLIQSVESTYPVKIKLGSIKYRWGRIELRNLQVTTMDGQTMVRIPVTRVMPAWGRLLTGRGRGVAAVDQVEVVEPVLHLAKDADGRWNIEQFIGKGQSSNKAWPDLVIRVKNGRVNLPSTIEGIAAGNILGLGAELRLSHRGQISWKASFQSSRDLKARMGSAGSYDRNALTGFIDVRIRELSLAMVEDTLKPRFGSAFQQVKSFKGRCTIATRVEIKDKSLDLGAVSIRLHQAGADWGKVSAPIWGVNGEVIAERQKFIIKNFHGRVGDGRVRLTGRADLSGKHVQGDVKLQANRMDLTVLRKLHPSLEKAEITGQGDARLRIEGSLENPNIRGEIRLRNVAGVEPQRGWKLTKVNTLARLDDQGVNLRYANGIWEGMRWNASGTVGLWEKKPEWKISFGFKEFDVKRLEKAFPVELDPVSGRGWIRGPLRAPFIAWDVRVPKIVWKGLIGQKGRVQGSYDMRSKRLAISRAMLNIDRGHLEAKGSVNLKEENPVLRGTLRGDGIMVERLPLDALSKGKIPDIGGRFDFKLHGSGRLNAWDTIDLAGSVEGRTGWIEGNAFRDLSTEFVVKQSKILLKNFNLRQDKGRMMASGVWMPTGALQGNVTLNRLKLRYKSPQGLEASSIFSGTVRLQRNDDGMFSGGGWLDAEDIKYDQRQVGDARLKVTANDRSIVLDDSVVMLSQNSRIKIDGVVDWEPNQPSMNIRLSLPQINWDTVKAFLPMKSSVEVNAKVQGDLVLTGPLFSPMVQGNLQAIQPEVAGRRFDHVEIDFSWRDRVMHIAKANLRQGRGNIAVQGDLAQGKLGLSVEVSEFPLRTLEFNLGGVPVQGSVEAKGIIGGDFKKPFFEGSIRGDDVNLAGLVIERTEGDLVWKNGQLKVDNLAINRGTQRLTVMGTVALEKEPMMDLRIKMETTRINELFLVVGFRPDVPMDGLISGQLKLSGPISDPRARLLASLERGYVYGYQQIHGELDLESKGKTFTVHKLRVADADGSFDASGEYTTGESLAMKLRVDNLSLAPIVSQLENEKGLEGRVDLQAELGTTPTGLRGKMVGRIREGKYREVFLPLTEFHSRIQDNQLKVDMAQKDLGLTVQGEGPIEAKWLSFLKLPPLRTRQNAAIRWHANAPHIDASLIGKFLPKAKFTEGQLGLNVNVRGTWAKPLFDGEVKVEGVKGKYDPLPEAFDGFNGVLRLTEQKLIIQEMSSKYGEGRASASGEIRFNGFMPSEMEIMVQTRRFYYESPSFEGLIDSHFQVGGTLRDPLIAGEAVVNKGRISIVSSKKIRRYDPRLNLRVRTGKDNYFRQFGVANVLINGELMIKGTMTRPLLDGVVTSNRGVLNLYGNSFRINSARAEFKPENGYYPYLQAQAKTKASGVEVTLSVDGWTGGNLSFQFRSVPERSYEEIIALLNWSEMTGKDGISLIQGNMNTLMDSVFGSVLDQFRDVLHVDFLTVEQDRIMGPLRLNMGKSVSDDLYLSYSRILSSDPEDLWSLEFMLTPHISLSGEHSGDDGTSLQLNFNFSF